MLDIAPLGFSGFNVTVSLHDPGIGEITAVTFPSGVVIKSNGTLPSGSVWIKGIYSSPEGNFGIPGIVLATVTYHGKAAGTTPITVTINGMTDGVGGDMKPTTGTPDGMLTVSSTQVPIYLLGVQAPPRDLHNDGLYEDLNGNGALDFNDVALFFNQMDWIAENEPVGAFDFNHNGRIDFNDIVTLFNEV